MFYQTLYFAVCYTIVVAVYVAGAAVLTSREAKREHTVARKSQRWLMTGTAVLFTLPVWPYAIVALQTALLRNTLQAPIAAYLREEYGGSSYRHFRVLSVRPAIATVFVDIPCTPAEPQAEEEPRVGLLLEWSFPQAKIVDEDVAWAECGSADGNTFPPYYSPKEF